MLLLGHLQRFLITHHYYDNPLQNRHIRITKFYVIMIFLSPFCSTFFCNYFICSLVWRYRRAPYCRYCRHAFAPGRGGDSGNKTKVNQDSQHLHFSCRAPSASLSFIGKYIPFLPPKNEVFKLKRHYLILRFTN